jgi:hypothetical protein
VGEVRVRVCDVCKVEQTEMSSMGFPVGVRGVEIMIKVYGPVWDGAKAEFLAHDKLEVCSKCLVIARKAAEAYIREKKECSAPQGVVAKRESGATIAIPKKKRTKKGRKR